MSDWLLTLLTQIGSIGAVSLIVKSLLKPISTALNSYAAGYANQTASIDARFANLERLAEEQAHITRTVETIRDEISMQAKSRDNKVLVQRETESWRAPLASITPFLSGKFAPPNASGGRRKGQRLAMQLVSKRRSGWVPHSPQGGGVRASR